MINTSSKARVDWSNHSYELYTSSLFLWPITEFLFLQATIFLHAFFSRFQVPAFETSDGKYITESNAIAYYGKNIILSFHTDVLYPHFQHTIKVVLFPCSLIATVCVRWLDKTRFRRNGGVRFISLASRAMLLCLCETDKKIKFATHEVT